MTLVDQANSVLDQAERIFRRLDPDLTSFEDGGFEPHPSPRTAPEVPDLVALRAARERLDGPLRVAVAGKVKAGKSTLLNALVGERLAPTDTSECTKVITWYRNGHTYEVKLHPADGSEPTQARFHRDRDAIEVDLGGRDAVEVDRLEITWPSQGLSQITLIDTPGVGSLTENITERAYEFLDPEDSETPADAVLFLMKHIHASDLRLLEAFHDKSVASPNPINAVAVISRADEIGAGRLDSMSSARRIAARYGEDQRLRRLAQIVIPIAGLLAETAATLTEAEFGSLRQLAGLPTEETESILLSADRFINARPDLAVSGTDRAKLLQRFGLFGVRLSLALMQRGLVESSAELAEELAARSGLSELQTVLTTLFVGRADVLKARSALLVVERLCRDHPDLEGVGDLMQEVERIIAGAHPFNELTTMAALRSGFVKGRSADILALERVLGSHGTTPWQRLDLEPVTSTEELSQAAVDQLARWQRVAENPFSKHDLTTAARVAIRSLEAILDKLGPDQTNPVTVSMD